MINPALLFQKERGIHKPMKWIRHNGERLNILHAYVAGSSLISLTIGGGPPFAKFLFLTLTFNCMLLCN